MTIRDYSGSRIIWTKHAIREAIEDNLGIGEIENRLKGIVELPEFEEEK